MLFFWPNKLFHYYSNNLSNWGKSKISSIKDCNWFLTWKSGTKSLNWPMNESVTTYTSCWIYRYIICFGATCRSRDDPGTKIGQTGFYSDSDYHLKISAYDISQNFWAVKAVFCVAKFHWDLGGIFWPIIVLVLRSVRLDDRDHCMWLPFLSCFW